MSEEKRHRAGPAELSDSLSAPKERPIRERPRLYEFGPFRLDPAERTLVRGNEIVPLTPKAFETLHMLVRNSGHLMEKEELIRALWPDTFVEEGSLSNNIFLLRKALGENPTFIETVPRRGYRFVGAVVQLPNHSANYLEESPQGHPELVNKPARSSRPSRPVVIWTGALIVVALAGGAALWRGHSSRVPDRERWIQLTKFHDSVVQPALSPDGRMLTFIRGDSDLIVPGQVYVKLLPDGEPVPLTHDDLLKMSPTFSPDGSRIAYTTVDPEFHWDTWVVPTLGGKPQLLLRNASGLSWTSVRQVLFSEIKTGVHMGIVAAEESRMGARAVYLPEDEPAMAHRSYLSPDGKWVLLVEMDRDHLWLPCGLVPMDGNLPLRRVGPLGGGCTAAAWSRDGKWMYFTASPGGVPHIWRQRFPDGRPEQITSGPTEEEGIAITPDGRSFVTAVALRNTSLWVHDARGERQISLQGNGNKAKFTPDGKSLCYLISQEARDDFTSYRNAGELKIAELESGRSESVVKGFPVLDYDISADSQKAVIWTTDAQGKSRLWLARLDRSSPPTEIPNVEGKSPLFAPDGDIFFLHLDGKSEYLYRVHPDGTGLRKAVKVPVLLVWAVSRDGKRISAWAPFAEASTNQSFALDGGPTTLIGGTFHLTWSLDGRAAFIDLPSRTATYVIPLPPGKTLPLIPAGGFHSEQDFVHLRGARRIDAEGVVPGPSRDTYAFYRNTVQRNLYLIPIP